MLAAGPDGISLRQQRPTARTRYVCGLARPVPVGRSKSKSIPTSPKELEVVNCGELNSVPPFIGWQGRIRPRLSRAVPRAMPRFVG
jgi:hypothetical protein